MKKKIFQKVTFEDSSHDVQTEQILSLKEIIKSLRENRNLFTIYKVTNPELYRQLNTEDAGTQNYDSFIQIQS